MYYVYLLKSIRFGQIYIGSTNDLRKRLKEHNQGKSFSTKRYKPWKLIYYEAFEKEKLARIREKGLKYNGNAVRELKKRIFWLKSGAGYTLIEILVGLTIIGLLFGFGFVSFRDFSRRQAIAGAGKELQGDLRLAQQIALSGKKPVDANCADPNFLNGYYFNVVSVSEYKILASCSGGSVSTVTKDVNMPPDISISAPSPNPVLFKVLGQGTNIPDGTSASIILTQAGTGSKATVTVSSGGEIQ